jgi:general L-amino acid transport system substrate-binding protein
VSVLVLDACRNNPLQGSDRRSLGSARGLSQSQPARGVFSIYSAGHNQEALDRLGPDDTHPNSVFTRVFIEKLKLPGIDLKVVATETRRAVAALAEKVGHEQYPAYYDQILGGDVYLAGRATAVLPAPSVTPAPLLRADPCAAAAEHWRSAEAINSKSAFDDHLARFPNCAFAGLARAKIEALAKSTEDRNKVAVVTPPLPPPAPPTPVKPAVGVTEQAPKASLAEKPAYPFEPDVLRVAVSPPSRPTPARGLLKAVKARGKLKCGINGNLPGFSAIGARGDWAGIDVDFCRAVAAAIFGDQRKVEFIRLTPTDRFTALQAGQVDVLSRNTSRTDDRESKLGLQFVGVNFYDGIAFLVPKSLGVGNVRQLDGVSICMHAGTVMELVVVEYFRNHRLRLTPVKYSTINEGIAAYDSRRCDTFVSDGSALSMMKGRTGKRDQHEILPDRLTKEALGPWVRQGDDQWLTLLRWALFAMIKAEELGITSGNIAARLASSDPATRRLLGRDGQLGRRLGVDDNWAVNIIKLVGNYGEVYARGVAAGHAISPERGMNALQRDGGLVAAPDIR